MSDPADVVFESVQESAQTDEDLEGAVLVGYVTVAEWSDSSGKRWLSTFTRDISGEAPPIWTVKGWLYYALHLSLEERA